MIPPVAKKIPKKLIYHDHLRIDPYFWMNNRKDPEVLAYLKSENDYTEHILNPVKNLREELFSEMKSRIKEEDQSAPYFKNGYWYYHRYEKGGEHPIYCRKKESLDNTEEILLNEEELAKGHAYYEIVSFSVSRDNNFLAYCEDITGRRLYQLKIKNLLTGEVTFHQDKNTGSDLAWLNNGSACYFTLKHPESLRPYQIWRLDTTSGKKQLIFEEPDETYICGLSKSKNSELIFIGSYSTLTTEFRFISAEDEHEPVIFLERIKGHEYYPEWANGEFYIRTNYDAENFKVCKCNFEKRTINHWQVIQPEKKSVFIEDMDLFNDYLVIQEKENGLTRLNIYDRRTKKHNIIPPFEETYTLDIGTNPEASQKHLRIGYSSMTTPHSVIDIDLKTFEKSLVKQTEVLGDFNSENYYAERVWAEASDGVKVPISLVYRKDKFKKDGTNPLLIYGYGSYGSTIDPYFSSIRLSLLDRGFVFAIAHVRGSEYLGREWYEEGKLLKKINTFNDFITCAEYLISKKYADKKNVFAMGGSAGGLLMGAIANIKPNLWKGIVSNVPFVDVVTTMLDDTIPLTTGEYDEWGNPHEKMYYEYMLSYSPYDQIEAKDYPAMLITSGLHDSQVQFWEPTKYVAKLRDLKTDQNPVLLHTNMEAGHGGASGRFEQLKEIAMEYAFILMLNRKE